MEGEELLNSYMREEGLTTTAQKSMGTHYILSLGLCSL